MTETEERETFTELVWIAEYPDKKSVVLVDGTIFDNFTRKQQTALIKSLIVLGLDKLSANYENAPNDLTINISSDKEHKNIVSGVSLLMNKNKQVEILVYFGGQADPKTTVKESLIHVMKMMRTVSSNQKTK